MYLVRDSRAKGTARETADGKNKPCEKIKCIALVTKTGIETSVGN